MTHKLGVGSVMIVLSTALFGVGCAKGVNFSGQSLNAPSSEGPVQNVNVPSCEINVPQYYLVGQVNSFEFTGSGGGTFGYNQNGAASGAGGSASVQISTASMSFTMDALNAMDLHSQIYGSTVTSDQTSVNLSGTVDFNQFNVDPNYYNSTPLATVALNGLNSAVQAIKKKTDSDPVGWVGRILQFEGSNVAIINAGSTSGVQQGDTFNIYNDQFFWQDNSNPCAQGNGYLGSQHVPSTPVAVATVTTVNSGTAFVSLVLSGQAAPILGAEVIPLNLVAPAKGQPARYLERNILLGTVEASSFALPGGVGTYDFGSAVNKQFRGAVNAGGFIVLN